MLYAVATDPDTAPSFWRVLERLRSELPQVDWVNSWSGTDDETQRVALAERLRAELLRPGYGYEESDVR